MHLATVTLDIQHFSYIANMHVSTHSAKTVTRPMLVTSWGEPEVQQLVQYITHTIAMNII